MSTKILNLAWDVDLPLSRKMVLIALADQANDYGEAYPGIASLQRRCSMGLRTVYDSLAELEAEGYLSRSQLPGKKALYSLNLDRLRQQDLLRPQPLSRGAATAGCGSRRGAGAAGVRTSQDAGNSKMGGAAAALYKSNQELKATTGDDDGREREAVTARYAEYEALTNFERTDCVDPYHEHLPLSLPLPVWVSFVKHRKAIRRPLSIAAFQLLLQDFRRLMADGVDLTESLNETVKAGLALPVNPNKSRRGQAPPRPRANDDFSSVRYVGTPDHELPDDLL